MEVVIAHDSTEVARFAAGAIENAVLDRPAPVIGLATGSSPLPTYRELIARHQRGELSFAAARAVILDEYVGLPADHPESYRSVIEREFVDHVDLEPASLFTPDTHADDIPDACRRYDDLVVELGVDVQILGIGSDGHLGFNEVGSSLASRTRIKTLTDRTRQDNARFFESVDEVPRHVVTQGLATIREAAHLVLVAVGIDKAPPIAAAIEGPVSASCPASVLQLHPHVSVLVDEAAASELKLADYYRETFRHKPSWQSL